MFCCIFHSEEVANKLLSPVIQGMALASGLFFPLDGISPWLARLSWLSPVKWVAEALFQLIYDDDTSLFLPVVMVLTVTTAAFLAGCHWTFRRENYV